MSGYDLIKEIHNSTGSWKPSFGSMYPLLKELNNNKLVTVKTSNRRKVYSITILGKKTLKDALKASHQIMDAMTKEFKIMENICSTHDKNHLDELMRRLKSDSSMFGGLTDEMDRLQRITISLLAHGKFESREKDIKKVINETIIKLKRIDNHD